MIWFSMEMAGTRIIAVTVVIAVTAADKSIFMGK
jgi:hypothetical protein